MIPCHVYRCARRAYTYLYLHPALAWDDLPPELAALFAGAEKIMELELRPDRPLAQEDVVQVMAHIEDPGYHLQLPPSEDPSGWLELPSTPQRARGAAATPEGADRRSVAKRRG